MEEQKKRLFLWLKKHDLITIRRLEQKCGLPVRSIHLAMKGHQALADKHLPAVYEELRKYGFKPPAL